MAKVSQRQITSKGVLLRFEDEPRICFINKEQLEVMNLMSVKVPNTGDTVSIADSFNRAGEASTEYCILAS